MSLLPPERRGKEAERWSDDPPLPRWALWLMLPGIVAPLLILGFIVLTESAHDPERCPYRELSRRSLGTEVVVVEEVRSCVGRIEEHRYTLRRGSSSRLLGERRFDTAAFARDRYRWSAQITNQGEVQVRVHNEGHEDLWLREGTPEERAKNISY
jgi:hypothetical protein